MKFDDILVRYLGEFGPYQKLQFALVCIPTIFTAMHALSWTFTGANVPFRCTFPDEPQDVSYNDNESFYISHNFKTWLAAKDENNPCKKVDGLSFSDIKSNGVNLTGKNLEFCDTSFTFSHEEIKKSAVEEWTIVCDRTWIRAFIQSMYYVGQFVGSMVFGVLADRYGRKKMFFAAILLQVTCGIIMAFVPWWPVFAIFRIGVGFAHPGIFLIAVVIGMELVGPSRRVVAGVLTGLFFSVGQIVLGVLAYYIRDYRNLQLAISLPALVFIVYWWIIPESARWLISQRRFEEADVILQKAARFNKRTLPANWYEMLDVDTKPASAAHLEKKYGFFDLFATPRIRQRTLITSFICWPAVSMVYYGLSMNPNFLGGDRYFVFISVAISEIPALLTVMFTMNIIGRKLLTMGGFLVAAVCLLMTMIIPESYPILMMIMIVLGKMSLCSVYALLYVFTPELFPTVIRSTAMGSCSMVARVGAVSASYIAMWLVTVSKVAVVVIFGSMCFIAGGAVTVLPETTGQKQFDTIEDAENFGGKRSLFSFSWKKGDQSVEVQPQDLAQNETKDKLLT